MLFRHNTRESMNRRLCVDYRLLFFRWP